MFDYKASVCYILISKRLSEENDLNKQDMMGLHRYIYRSLFSNVNML